MADGSEERREGRFGGESKMITLGLAGIAAAAGAGLFLWSRRRELAGEESSADEVEAHPS
jgi:LPXTG-motif cell wall-anchored protein